MTAFSKLGVVVTIALCFAACDHNTGSGGGDAGGGQPGDDLAVGSADDLAVPLDLAAPQTPMDLAIPTDLQIVCDTDANDRACGSVCITMAQCCTAADCPMPANGNATCDSTTHACGVSCSPGYRGCGSLCIPSDPDDGGVSMSTDGGSYSNACCVDSDCPATGEVCPTPGAPCACPSGQKLCPASNRCIPDTDCCTPSDCPSPTNGTATCTNGTCDFTCSGGFNKCGSDCAPSTDQCCMTSDCPTDHDSPMCINGTCGGTCDPGWTDCDGNKKTNGCETNTGGDATNCGTCGHICSTANGTASCNNGICQISCSPGFADCDGSNSNGCEVNTNTDPTNCGGCGNGCAIANGTAACVGGMCAVGSCLPGWADCDGLASNGCETNLNDPSSCGTCGHVCNVPNATAGCSGGTCTVASCNAGFSDCDLDPANGCEIQTSTDPLNCGTCNNQCSVANGTAGCTNGTCTVAACNGGFGDCDGQEANGCETNLNTDDGNCGACGNDCAVDCSGNVTATSCTTGTCTITTCGPGYLNLDNQCADGCECKINTPSQTCSAPNALGTLTVGQTITVSNNLVPTGVEGYYTVTLTGNTNFSYHPHVKLVTNTNNEYLFDVRVDCNGTAIACGTEGGFSNGVTDWETLYTAGDPSQPSEFLPIPPVGNAGTLIIHVYRKMGAATSCTPFTLQISN